MEASDIIAGLVIAQGQLIRNVGCAFESAFFTVGLRSGMFGRDCSDD